MRVEGLGFRFQGAGFRVQGLGLRVQAGKEEGCRGVAIDSVKKEACVPDFV